LQHKFIILVTCFLIGRPGALVLEHKFIVIVICNMVFLSVIPRSSTLRL
jgi:hypothetical protein